MLDDGVPRPLATRLCGLGIDAVAFPNAWKQLSNGKLLDAVERHGYDVLLTNDKSMPYQQDLRMRRVAIVILPTNRLRDVLANAQLVVRTIASVEPGAVVAMPAFAG